VLIIVGVVDIDVVLLVALDVVLLVVFAVIVVLPVFAVLGVVVLAFVATIGGTKFKKIMILLFFFKFKLLFLVQNLLIPAVVVAVEATQKRNK